MTFRPGPRPRRLRHGLFALALLAVLLALFLGLPPDGAERADWAQFLGRFHLLLVHFPIALVLLVPVLEWAGRRPATRYLHASTRVLWALALCSSLAAASLGWCLARSGGYSGRLVAQHMWGGLGVGAACWLCWMLRGSLGESGRLGYAYLAAMSAAVLLVAWTGYRGGQLSQGEGHLTEHMPAALRRLIGMATDPATLPRSNPAFFYGAHVEPVFVGHCYECHGPDKQKGRLRLDSYEALMRGGKHGAVIKAGNVPGSPLFHRVTLAPEDDDAMPPQGKRPLSAGETRVLSLWIAAGASPTLPADAIKDIPGAAAAAPAEVTFPEMDTAAVTKARAPLAAAVRRLQQQFPDLIEYESRGSAGLAIDASALGAKFTDDELAALATMAAGVVAADFSNTAITDRSASVLATMKHARMLRLTNSRIGDVTVNALAGLNELQSLNLYGTAVTPACLQVLQRLPKLQHLYAGATRISADGALPGDLQSRTIF